MPRDGRVASRIACCLLLLALAPALLLAGGGPRNVLVVVNDNSAESVEIASYYVQMREIPAVNLCHIQTTENLSTDKAVYQTEIEQPILDCIAATPYSNRIDYIVLTRGMPIRAAFPGGNVAVVALLQAMDTTLRGKDQEGVPNFMFYGNPYRDEDEHFSHAKQFGGHNLYIATMLSGLNVADAKGLVDRSLASDWNPPTDAPGSYIYYENATPDGGAADIRNSTYPSAIIRLRNLGINNAIHVLHTDPDITGSVVASHMSSGVYSQINRAEIDSNTYPPGCIVDALQSYGLVPRNFVDDGDFSQTPITWWVAAGITAGHGTVAEPYNVAFPDSYLLEPYVQGYNVGETFYQGIPYLYWMNLVLGDPLAAPWAEPPVATIEAPADGATVSRTVSLEASAVTTKVEGIERLEFFIDDTLVHTAMSDVGRFGWDSTTVADGPHRFDVVAYENTKYYTQATAGIDITVNNTTWAAITDPLDGASVTGVFPVTVETSPGMTGVRVEAGGTPVGTGSGGPPFVVDVDSAALARGWVVLTAVADDGAGTEATSNPVDVYIEKAPEVLLIDPVEGPASGGTTVSITGGNFEAGIRVFFDGVESPAVTVLSETDLEAETPAHPAAVVDVRLENPAGSSLDLTGAFTYVPDPCACTTGVEQLALTRHTDGRLGLGWQELADPCLASYRVLVSTDPVPGVPPIWPDGYADITDLDEDGDIGGDTYFLFTPGTHRLALYQVAGQGTDGSLGPR